MFFVKNIVNGNFKVKYSKSFNSFIKVVLVFIHHLNFLVIKMRTLCYNKYVKLEVVLIY